MKKALAAVLFLSLLALAALPARAQFYDQLVWGGTGGGSANAYTVTIHNVTTLNQLIGVKLMFVIPTGQTNTGPSTLQIASDSFTSGTVAVRKLTGSGLAALTGTELVALQPVMVTYDGTFFDIISGQNTNTTSATLANSALGFELPVNLQINASVGSNQLTVSVVGNNGATPSATNPVIFPFRDPTIANGDPIFISLTSALSFTVASGNTQGCANGQMCKLWVVAINNAGTIGLCLYNTINIGTPSLVPLDESTPQNSAGGTSGGSSTQTLYCSISSVAAKSVRYLGYIEIQETTAGTWATGPTKLQLLGPGVKKPGEVLQRFAPTTNAFSTSCTTGGANVGSQAITPTSAANPITLRGMIIGTPIGSNATIQGQWARGASLIGQLNRAEITSSAGIQSVPMVETWDFPNTTSSTTYNVFCTVSTGTTGGNGTSMVLEELQSMLEPSALKPEPANDDVEPAARKVA